MDFAAARRTMIDTQLRTYDVSDLEVLAAIEAVAREGFVSAGQRPFAYVDHQIVVTAGEDISRTLLAPMVLARMIQSAQVRPDDRVLDVAGGSGYSAAVLSRLAGDVVALEEMDPMAALARRSLDAAGCGAVRTVSGPLAAGVRSEAPFDLIFVNGAMDVDPDGLFAQLSDGGRLVGLKGRGRSGRVMVYRKAGDGISGRPVFDAAAPPLPGFARAEVFTF